MFTKIKILNVKKYETFQLFSSNRLNGWVLFSTACIFYFLILYISNNFIFTDQLYYRSFSDKFTFQTLASQIDIQNQYWWLGYVITPLLIFLKISFTAICISIGTVLSNIEFKFKTIFKAALLAEVIFIVAQIMYMINLSIHLDTVTLATAANYFPFSILSIYGTENVVDWLQYPLQTLNLFEVFYMAAIAWLLAKQWSEDFIESLAVVVPSYVTGLVLWLVLVTFLTLQVS